MFCKNCGKEVKSGAKFCPSCGTVITYENKANITPVPPAQQSAQPSPMPGTVYIKEADPNLAPVMSVWSYIIMFWISAIPIVGFVVILISALDSTNKNKNKTNYCRAILLNMIIGVLIIILFGSVFTGLLYSLI